ncbi:hypothetical protein ACVW2K_002772 [Nocardioides sp. HB32]
MEAGGDWHGCARGAVTAGRVVLAVTGATVS